MDVGSSNPFDLLAQEDGAPKKRAPKKEKPKEAPKDTRDKGRDNRGPRDNKGRDNNRRTKGSHRGGNKQRQFDRRSATGRGKEVSKNGHGRGGWGNESRNNFDGEAPVQEKTEETTAVVEEEVVEEVVEEEPEEPEEVTLSYDEYQAELKTRSLAEDDHQSRRADVDEKSWKNVVEKDEVSGSTDDEKYVFVKKETKGKKKNKKKKKTVMCLDAFTAQAKPSNNNRGNRNRNRSDRGPRNGGKVNLKDNSSFPSLGGK